MIRADPRCAALAWCAGFGAYLKALDALAATALLLGAVAAWPAAPCDAPWVSVRLLQCVMRTHGRVQGRFAPF